MQTYIGPVFSCKRMHHGNDLRDSEILLKEVGGKSYIFDAWGERYRDEEMRKEYPDHRTYDRYVKEFVAREKFLS